MKKKILGIDLRGNSVKVVGISKSPIGIFLEKWEKVHIPFTADTKNLEKEKAQTKALNDILSKYHCN